MVDCPQCGVTQIRSTTTMCGECEVTERYEKRLSDAEARIRVLETAGRELVDKLCDGTYKIRDVVVAAKIFGENPK